MIWSITLTIVQPPILTTGLLEEEEEEEEESRGQMGGMIRTVTQFTPQTKPDDRPQLIKGCN